ncbi:MAG: LbtU family siderophore porin, partial [Desulfatitalea sp.]|nr:LbtU family siderophore porin [Desulfatitalea sp.]NNK01402.1 LbtU family siderophore porin [Desulfatitalea sp.]
WYDRIQASGLIEVAASQAEINANDPTQPDETMGDVDLSTIELVVDARIIAHVDGHVMLKYEADEVFVDEGFITLTGPNDLPVYLIAGRQYIPFGNFDSHFVTDPATLVLGETNEGAVVAGYRFAGERLDLSVGAFNGRIGKAGDDDAIDSFVAAAVLRPMDSLLLGVSYSSNLGASDNLSEAVTDTSGDGSSGPIQDLVGGWAAFVSYEFFDRFKFIGEYAAALDDFEAGALYDENETQKRQPSAWNIELGALLIDGLQLAIRYGGSEDGGSAFLPETEYAVVLDWGFVANTNLSLEYLHAEFEDDAQEIDAVTAQLAVTF